MTTLIAQWMAGVLGVGGAGVLVSGRAELQRRWTTWIVIALTLVVAFALRPYGPAVLASVCGVVCAVEYARLARLQVTDVAVLVATCGALPVLGWLAPDLLARLVPLAALAVALPALLGQDARGARRAAASAFGVLWLAPLTGLVLLGDSALPLVLAVCVADVTAWCGGKVFRGPALSRLSPAKTWGGVAGSAIGGLGILAALGALSWPLAVAVVLGPPLGDLLESMVKRTAGVKDTGAWLPGFGGMLDRVDSLLVTFAIAIALGAS